MKRYVVFLVALLVLAALAQAAVFSDSQLITNSESYTLGGSGILSVNESSQFQVNGNATLRSILNMSMARGGSIRFPLSYQGQNASLVAGNTLDVKIDGETYSSYGYGAITQSKNVWNVNNTQYYSMPDFTEGRYYMNFPTLRWDQGAPFGAYNSSTMQLGYLGNDGLHYFLGFESKYWNATETYFTYGNGFQGWNHRPLQWNVRVDGGYIDMNFKSSLITWQSLDGAVRHWMNLTEGGLSLDYGNRPGPSKFSFNGSMTVAGSLYAENLTVNSSLSIGPKTGNNCTMSAGSCVISNSAVTANSKIICAPQTSAANVGTVWVSSITPGVSYRVDSTSATMSGEVYCEIRQMSV